MPNKNIILSGSSRDISVEFHFVVIIFWKFQFKFQMGAQLFLTRISDSSLIADKLFQVGIGVIPCHEPVVDINITTDLIIRHFHPFQNASNCD